MSSKLSKTSGNKEILRTIVSWIITIVSAVLIFLLIYSIIISPHHVTGKSMEPNLFEDQFVFIDKVSYKFRNPKRGEIILLVAENSEKYLKRIIGISGDEIEIKHGEIYINGELIDENEYLTADVKTDNGTFVPPGVVLTVPDNSVFVLGDNRPESFDSRSYGFIEKEKIIGKAFLRYWPINEISTL